MGFWENQANKDRIEALERALGMHWEGLTFPVEMPGAEYRIYMKDVLLALIEKLGLEIVPIHKTSRDFDLKERSKI